MSGRTLFRSAAAVLILGAVAHVATLWPRVETLAGTLGSSSWLLFAGYALSALTALAACGLAALLLWKASDRAEGRALTLFLAFLAVFWGSVFRFLQIEVGDASVEVTLSYRSGWVSQTALLSFLLAAAAFLRFSALFPRPLRDRMPPLGPGRLPFRQGLRRVRLAFLGPVTVWGSAVAVYLVQRLIPPLIAELIDADATQAGQLPRGAILGFLLVMLLLAAYAVFAMALGARNLRDGFRLAPPDERARILWVVAGFSLAWWLVLAAAGLMAVGSVLGDGLALLSAAVPVALVLAPLVAVVGAAFGVLYSGAIDPALALERSTVYGALGVIGIVGFAALENALSELVEQWVRLPGFLGTMAAGAVVAAALIPLRGVLRHWVRHSRDDATGE